MSDGAPDLARLKGLWRTHMQAIGATSAERVAAVFDHLCTSYGEPHRRYHTLAHIDALFTLIETEAAAVSDPLPIAFAVWFHDVIYDTRRQDNEALSAGRAERHLTVLGAPPDVIARTAALILATRDHRAGAPDADGRLFLDADLAIIGAPAAAYDRYAREVRAEYDWLDDAAWRAGRGAFLDTLARAPRLFHTDAFETRFGEAARANLARERRALGLTG